MHRYNIISLSRLRLLLLKHLQIRSLQKATGALFLTQYASDIIQQFTGKLNCVRVIPHGIGENFKQEVSGKRWKQSGGKIVCVYVSNADLYKHQWHVVRAISKLRKSGHPVHLKLVGGGQGPATSLLHKVVMQEDPDGDFIEVIGAVSHSEVPGYLANADIFIFASSCENMPNTLVEAMASALPIASSDRGPMPEILGSAGSYFDPEDSDSIADAVEKLIVDESFRSSVATEARALAEQYSWSRCGGETWDFVCHVDTISR